MINKLHVSALTALLVVLAVAPARPASTSAAVSAIDEAMSYDGLQRVTIRGVELAYFRPGVSLAGYTKVQIAPVEVSFHKDWNPTRTGSRLGLTDRDRDRIRTNVARIVSDQFASALEGRGGFAVVTHDGPDVLLVKPNIVNLYVTAPDTLSPSRTRSFVVSAGQMTLVLQLEDSETGAVIARIIDRQRARQTGNFRLSTGVSNAAEARDAASRWAQILRRELDAAAGRPAQ